MHSRAANCLYEPDTRIGCICRPNEAMNPSGQTHGQVISELTGIKVLRTFLRHGCCRGLVAFPSRPLALPPQTRRRYGAAVLFPGRNRDQLPRASFRLGCVLRRKTSNRRAECSWAGKGTEGDGYLCIVNCRRSYCRQPVDRGLRSRRHRCSYWERKATGLDRYSRTSSFWS
jgi:hypothetical protein